MIHCNRAKVFVNVKWTFVRFDDVSAFIGVEKEKQISRGADGIFGLFKNFKLFSVYLHCFLISSKRIVRISDGLNFTLVGVGADIAK